MTSVRRRDEFVSLAVLREIYPRGLRGWHLSRPLDQALPLTALRRALAHHQPALPHADPGVQYAATASMHTLPAHGSQRSLAASGEAPEHGSAERLMRTITEADVPLHEEADCHEAYQHRGRFCDEVYQHQRIHAALGSLTPAAFETPWRQRLQATTPAKVERPYNGPTLWGHYNAYRYG